MYSYTISETFKHKINLFLVDKIFCYYASWAASRRGVAQLLPENIPFDDCSHLIYAFIRPGTGETLAPFTNTTLKSLVRLRNLQPKLKILAAIGGWNAGSVEFSNV